MNAIRDGDHIRIYHAYPIKESIKEIPGHFYDTDDKAWLVPYTEANTALLRMLGVSLSGELMDQRDMEPEWAHEEPVLPMPISAKPYQHQVRAFNFALRQFGIGGQDDSVLY